MMKRDDEAPPLSHVLAQVWRCDGYLLQVWGMGCEGQRKFWPPKAAHVTLCLPSHSSALSPPPPLHPYGRYFARAVHTEAGRPVPATFLVPHSPAPPHSSHLIIPLTPLLQVGLLPKLCALKLFGPFQLDARALSDNAEGLSWLTKMPFEGR